MNMSDKVHGNKGRKLSEETKKKISEALKGRTVSEETRRKIGEVQMGRRNQESLAWRRADYSYYLSQLAIATNII